MTSLHRAAGWVAAGLGVLLIGRAVAKALTKFELANKVVLITGGSRGLGFALARHLAEKGARLAICARSGDQLELARQELEGLDATVTAMTVDVTSQQEVQALIRDVISRYGRLDVLINSAGVIEVEPHLLSDAASYRVALQTSLWSQLFAMHAAIPHFIDRGEGRIANITTVGGKLSVPELLPYSGDTTAPAGLSERMLAELKKHNIIVTTVVPNLMHTGAARRAGLDEGFPEPPPADGTMLPQDTEAAAAAIVKAIESGEPEAVLTLGGKLAQVVKGIAPGWVAAAMGLAGTLLPDAVTNPADGMAAPHTAHKTSAPRPDHDAR